MSPTEDDLLEMSTSGRAMADAALVVLGSDDLVSNVSIATLTLLYTNGPQHPTQIAELTGLTSAGATKLITRLENAGLVVREAGTVPADGRAIVVSLTGFGSQKVEGVITIVALPLESVISWWQWPIDTDAFVAKRHDADGSIPIGALPSESAMAVPASLPLRFGSAGCERTVDRAIALDFPSSA